MKPIFEMRRRIREVDEVNNGNKSKGLLGQNTAGQQTGQRIEGKHKEEFRKR